MARDRSGSLIATDRSRHTEWGDTAYSISQCLFITFINFFQFWIVYYYSLCFTFVLLAQPMQLEQPTRPEQPDQLDCNHTTGTTTKARCNEWYIYTTGTYNWQVWQPPTHKTAPTVNVLSQHISWGRSNQNFPLQKGEKHYKTTRQQSQYARKRSTNELSSSYCSKPILRTYR